MSDDTLSGYMSSGEWADKTTEEKVNVLATYVIDLENEVERLKSD